MGTCCSVREAKYYKNEKKLILNNDNNISKNINDINDNYNPIQNSKTEFKPGINNEIKKEALLYKNEMNKSADNIELNDTFPNSYNPYLSALLISLYEIPNIKIFFNNEYNFIKNKNGFTYSIYQYMKSFKEKNISKCRDIISDLNNEIKLDEQIPDEKDFEYLINFILSKLHEEMKKGKTTDQEWKKDDFDENTALYNFNKFYLKQNNSDIQHLFFGTKKNIEFFPCCGLKNYSFENFKFIKLNTDNIENSYKLQDLLNEWETKTYPSKKFCSMCFKDRDILFQHMIYKNPKILIIIINNINKKEIEFKENINTRTFNYKLFCYITKLENESNFNIIYLSNNHWHLVKNIDNDETKGIEEDIEIDTLKGNPSVLFYERIHAIAIKTNEINNLGSSNFLYNNNYFNQNTNLNNSNYLFSSIGTNNLINNAQLNMINKAYLKYPRHIKNNTIYSNPKIFQPRLPFQAPINNKYRSSKTNYTIYYLNKYFINNNNNFNNNNKILINGKNSNLFEAKNSFNKIKKTKIKSSIDDSVKNIPHSARNNGVTPNYKEYKNNIELLNKIYYNKINNNNTNINSTFIKNNNITLNTNNNMTLKTNNNIPNPTINYANNITQNYNYNNYKLNPTSIIQTNPNNYLRSEYNNNIDNYSNSTKDNITLLFKFSNGKDLYLDVEENITFNEVIKELKKKYLWLNDIKIKNFFFNGKIIPTQKTLKEIGIKDGSLIIISEL